MLGQSTRDVRAAARRRTEGERSLNPLNRGWVVTLSALGVNLALGVLYTWSAFAHALSLPAADGGKHLWTTQQATLPHAFTLGFFALTMVFAGRLQDRFGPRWVATAGGGMIGLGMIVASLSPTHLPSETSYPYWMVLGFGVLTGIGIGLAYAAATPAAVKWFPPRRRGLITGIVVSGFAFASLFSAAHTAALIDAFGVNRSFVFLGVVLFIVISGLSQFIADPPKGFVPPGSYSEEAPVVSPPPQELAWRSVLRTRSFYLLWATLGCASFAGLMVAGILDAAASAQLGSGPAITVTSALVVALALGDTLGRPLSGLVSDRIGRRQVLLAVLVLQAALLLGAQFATTPPFLIAIALFSGLTYGADITLLATTTFDFYGMKNAGANYGMVFTAWAAGALFATPVAERILARTTSEMLPQGSFELVFTVAAGLCLLAAGSMWLLHQPSPGGSERPVGGPSLNRQA